MLMWGNSVLACPYRIDTENDNVHVAMAAVSLVF
jgi:hypothetical protein